MKSSTTGKNGMTCYYRLKQSANNRFPFCFLNNVQVQRSTVRAPCGAVNVSWLCGLCFQSGAGSMRRVFVAVGVRAVGGARVQADGFNHGWNSCIFHRHRQVNFGFYGLCVWRILRQDGVMVHQWRTLDGQCVPQPRELFCSFLRKMSTPLTLPVKDQDCGELRKTGDHVFEGRSALFVQTAVWGRAVAPIMTERRLEKVQSRKEDLNKDPMINIL